MKTGKRRRTRKSHNELFRQAYERYLKDRTDKNLELLYKITYELAKNYIFNYGKKRGVHIPDAEIKAHDTAAIIIERKFLKRVGAPINKLSSYIYKDCYHQIVKDSKHEQNRIALKDYEGYGYN